MLEERGYMPDSIMYVCLFFYNFPENEDLVSNPYSELSSPCLILNLIIYSFQEGLCNNLYYGLCHQIVCMLGMLRESLQL